MGKVVWYSHLFKNFPQILVIHIVKGFSIVSEAEIDVFLELPCFLHDPMNVGKLNSGSSVFLKPGLYIWVMHCWSLAWRILSRTLLACEMSAIVGYFIHSLACPSLGLEWKLFQSCGHCWIFQICWHTECRILTSSSFRIWNSSTGIPSFPQALFAVTFPKAHLTSHSRMSSFRWVPTLSWLSESLGSFLYSSFVYSCNLFFISSASVRCLLFLSFIVPIFGWNVPLIVPIFLKRSLVLPFLMFSSISLPCSLKKAFFSLLNILWNSAFSQGYLSVAPFLFVSLLF